MASNRTVILVTGSRHMKDHLPVFEELAIWRFYGPVLVVHGGHKSGADSFASRAVRTFKRQGLDYEQKPFPANWTLHGKAAGPIRNQEMVEFVATFSDRYCAAFWDGRTTKCGTFDTIKRANAAGIEVALMPVT